MTAFGGISGGRNSRTCSRFADTIRLCFQENEKPRTSRGVFEGLTTTTGDSITENPVQIKKGRANKMKRKPRESISVEALEHIDLLAQTGLDNMRIATILNRSESNVRRYRHALAAVRGGTAYDKPGNIGNISIKAVNEWARKHGFSDLIVNDPTKREEIPGQIAIDDFTVEDMKTEDPIKTAINMLNGIGIQFHALAEYLYKNFVKENHK